MKRSVLAFKNYEVHAITTVHEGRPNAHIATWVMQSALKGRGLAVALYKPSLTYELVRESGVLNVNLLCEAQKRHVNRLGKRSGRDLDKLARVPHAFDERGCPYLTEAIGYVACRTVDRADALDHVVFTCEVLRQRVLHPDAPVLTSRFLKEHGYIR